MSKPTLETVTVGVADESAIANRVVFSTGSRGFNASFKALINVGTEEKPDLRKYQVGMNIIEVGTKGEEDYESFKAEKNARKAAKLREAADALLAPTARPVDTAPRLSPAKS